MRGMAKVPPRSPARCPDWARDSIGPVEESDLWDLSDDSRSGWPDLLMSALALLAIVCCAALVGLWLSGAL